MDDPLFWTTWELGYPSERCESLLPWAEDSSCPTETVYPMVPSWVVMELLAAHGGWVGDPMDDLLRAKKDNP
jgi:hypothetical protein